MDTKRLVSFVRSAELGSLSAAAEELGYTPSAVSQLVASLENEFGVQLLVRTTRGVYPTAEGKGLIPLVEEYMEREDKIVEYMNNVKDISDGTLTIAAYPSIATLWLPGVISEFSKEFPGISINIIDGTRPDIFRHLDSTDAELGFLAYTEPMPYEWIPLADVDMLAVVPEDHLLASSSSFPVTAIEDNNFILSSMGEEPEVLNILSKYGVHPEIKFTTYDTPVNMAMVQQGLGVSICNELSIRRWNDHIVKLPLDPPEKVNFGIAVRSQDTLSALAKRFLDYCVKHLAKVEQ